jgi:hypothetical protein
MAAGLVRFICVAPDHSNSGRDAGGGVLTIISGEWAFCPWGKTEKHIWDRTDGIDVPTARAMSGRKDPSAPTKARP